jgi:hypothetical protein
MAKETLRLLSFGPDLTEEQKRQVLSVFNGNNVLVLSDPVPGSVPRDIAEYSLPLKVGANLNTIKTKRFGLAGDELKILESQIDDLLAKGMIIRSAAEITSPAFSVPKKDEEMKIISSTMVIN